jgi:site-specific DNA-methyltransferase (adenine-specific)
VHSVSVLVSDATHGEAYAALLGGALADSLHTDPPYCLLTRRQKDGTLRSPSGAARLRKLDDETVVRFESVRAYSAFTDAWLAAALPRVKPDGTLAIWTNALGRTPLLRAVTARGWVLRGEFVWAKPTKAASVGAVEARSSEVLLRAYESALVFTRCAGTRPPGVVSDDWEEAALPWAIVSGYTDWGEEGTAHPHPHHKPFKVIAPLVATWTRKGDVVLDPFVGSGAILAAARRLGRGGLGMEIKQEWADFAIAAWRKAKPSGPAGGISG